MIQCSLSRSSALFHYHPCLEKTIVLGLAALAAFWLFVNRIELSTRLGLPRAHWICMESISVPRVAKRILSTCSGPTTAMRLSTLRGRFAGRGALALWRRCWRRGAKGEAKARRQTPDTVCRLSVDHSWSSPTVVWCSAHPAPRCL